MSSFDSLLFLSQKHCSGKGIIHQEKANLEQESCSFDSMYNFSGSSLESVILFNFNDFKTFKKIEKVYLIKHACIKYCIQCCYKYCMLYGGMF